MHKLSHLQGDLWVEHSHTPTFAEDATTSGQRLVVGVPAGDPVVFSCLVNTLEPPYLLLYILHTPRGEGDPGRYQSPKLSPAEFQRFMQTFGGYLSSDARFDLWSHSPSENATVVWDRHNQVFGYGPLDRYKEALRALGFTEGKPAVPVPHQHHYRQAFDEQAKAVLSSLNWSRTSLQPEDEQ